MKEQERLEELFEQHKNDLDGGFFNALVEFSEEAFNKLKELGDKAKVRDLHSYIVSAYLVGKERQIKNEIRLNNEIKKLK
ncbi:MAG: hypothetical protein J6T74_04235 [Clostridia bacterium]|nr:hypothetical protein [Clostridia bacterium]